ncbi:MAG: hypothetical protein QXQ48_00390 [Nitrososphaerota archaeon]
MTYWVPWSDTELFFETPQELSVTTPEKRGLTDDEVISRISRIPESPYVFIDYLPPSSAYRLLLDRLANSARIVYVSSWRLGLDKLAESVAELERLERRPPLAPIREFADEDHLLESTVLIYPRTSRLLLQDVVKTPEEHLTWLLKIYGLGGLANSATRLYSLELSYDSEGTIQGIWTQNDSPPPPTPSFESVVVSPGKAPLDSTFYLAAQSIILSSPACKEGSTILSVSECKDGLGPPEFVKQLYNIFKMGQEGGLTPESGPSEVMAYKLARVLRSYRTYLVTSLPRSLARTLLGLKAFDTLQEGITQLLRLHGRSHKMLLIKDGLHRDPSTLEAR